MTRFEMSERPALIDRLLTNTTTPSDWHACWLWSRAKNYKGYGQMSIHGKNHPAHRVAYALAYGVIDPDKHLDHLCKVRHCVNPLHLEAVTPAENNRRSECFSTVNARKTHCPKGHPYDDANTYVNRSGARMCRRCGWMRDQVRYAAKSAARKAAREQ